MKQITTTYIIQADDGSYYDGDGWTSVRDYAETYAADDLPDSIQYRGMTLELCDGNEVYCDADDPTDMWGYAGVVEDV